MADADLVVRERRAAVAGGPEGVPCAAADVPAPYREALRLLLAGERVYLRISRLTTSAEGYREPGAFCRERIAEALPGRVPEDGASRSAFFTWALRENPRSRLLPVLASEDHLARGQDEEARAYAAQAVSRSPHDLHAQRLHRRCDGGRDDAAALAPRFCNAPFDNIETQPGGDVHFCCPSWLPVPIGNLERQTAEEIWNSKAAQDIRRSILDGSYRYCSRLHCPKLSAAGGLPSRAEVKDRRHRSIIEQRTVVVPGGPRRVSLSHDRSCNLSCPSCRVRTLIAGKGEQDRLDRLADRVILPMLRDARRVHLTGSGDPFGSGHFRYILKRLNRIEYPQLRLNLQTNGLLLDRKAWSDLELEGLVENVHISVDAARPETYAIVRRGGSFDRLLQNLGFVAGLRREGQVRHVRLDVVVQTLNFREMPEVVDLCRSFGFDGVKFQMIRNWGTYRPDEFEWHNIGAPTHPEHAALLQVLEDERLRAGPVEFWGFYGVAAGRLRSRAETGETGTALEAAAS